MRMKQRIDALEQGSTIFHGYALVWRYVSQTIEQAVEAWEAENGPVGERQVVVFNFGAA